MTGGVLRAGGLRSTVSEGTGEGPAPGLWAQAGGGWRLTEDKNDNVVEKRIFEGYRAIEDTLVQMGHDRGALRHKPIGPFGLPILLPDVASRTPDTDAIWAAMEAARLKDPQQFRTVPKTQAAFEEWLLTRKGARGDDQRMLARGTGAASTVAQFIGGVGGGFTDPVNILTMPFGGGGKTVAQAFLREGLLNGTIELLQAPQRAVNAQRMGEQTTAGDIALDVGGAFVGGGLLGGSFKGVELHGRDALESVLAKVWDKLPDRWLQRYATPADIPDSALPDLAEDLLGPRMTADERAAAAVIRREDWIERANPHGADGAGEARYAQGLGAALQRVLDAAPADMPRPVARALDADGIAGLRTGTAPAALLAGEPRAALKARIGLVESGGDDAARAATSSAMGKYQFTAGTWLRLFERRLGRMGLSDAEILAKRSNPALQDALMDDLLAANGAALRRGGHEETADNLYLAHFLGPDGARRVLDAEPGARLDGLLEARAIAANPFLKGMTAGELRAWSARKMGAAVPDARGADPEADLQARLQGELDRLEADRLAYEAGQGRAGPDDDLPEPVMAEPEPLDLPDPALAPAHGVQAAPPPVRTESPVRPEAAALVEPLRRIVRETGQSLSDLTRIAKGLRADARDVRAAMTELARRGEVRGRLGKDGTERWIRPPVDRAPVDALKYVARMGGIDPRGEAEGGGRHDLRTIFQTTNRKGVRGVHFVPGGGALVRDGGRTLDDVGQALWEAGYFGPPSVTDRPSIADTLALLEDSFRDGKPRYAVADTQRVVERELSAQEQDAQDRFWNELKWHADDLGVRLNPDELDAITRMAGETGLSHEAALVDWMNMELDAARWDALAETDKAAYEAGYDDRLGRTGQEGGAGGASRSGPGREPGDPGPQPADRQAWPPADEWASQSEEALGAFADPDGPAVQAQVASLEHDMRIASGVADPEQADAFGGATRAEQRQALERRGEGGLQAPVAQKAPGSDGGLFDPQAANEMRFRFDEEGETQGLADMMRAFDEEEVQIKTIRDCL